MPEDNLFGKRIPTKLAIKGNLDVHGGLLNRCTGKTVPGFESPFFAIFFFVIVFFVLENC
jgi:hypothetical protein